MDDGRRGLLRLTNILCNNVFSLCRNKDYPDGEFLTRNVSEKIQEIIGMMDRHIHSHKE